MLSHKRILFWEIEVLLLLSCFNLVPAALNVGFENLPIGENRLSVFGSYSEAWKQSDGFPRYRLYTLLKEPQGCRPHGMFLESSLDYPRVKWGIFTISQNGVETETGELRENCDIEVF